MSDSDSKAGCVSFILFLVTFFVVIGGVLYGFYHMGWRIAPPNSVQQPQPNPKPKPKPKPSPGGAENQYNLSGTWDMASLIVNSSRSQWNGKLTLYYRLRVKDSGGTKLTVTGTKYAEMFNNEVYYYQGAAKTSFTGTGTLDTSVQPNRITFHIDEGSTIDTAVKSKYVVEVTNTHQLDGTFSSSAAKAKGTTLWTR